jgi:NAD(P)-dependent dehydrogenase (short-subunit alcohol dehydrogenase family)
MPGLVAAQSGSVTNNMGSITWVVPATGLVPYAESKSAVVGLTKTLAHEIGPNGVRVNRYHARWHCNRTPEGDHYIGHTRSVS